MWLYQGKEFTSDDINDAIGFIYEIIDKTNGKKYIGKKLLTSKRKLRPLKGKVNRRIVSKETDWQTYYGSNELIKKIVSEEGPNRFERHILRLCFSKGELSYREAELQFKNKVLFKEEYYNDFIGCRIHSKHVNKMKDDDV